MSKKELRKELEHILIKTLEDVLNKQNAEATKKINKTIHEASKLIAKKFSKIMKPVTDNKIITPKKVVRKTVVPIKRTLTPSNKKVLQK